MKPKKIYALYKNGVPIDSGSAVELAEKLGTARALIPNYARDGLTYKGQYTFLDVGLANARAAAKQKWVEDWDRVRKQILTTGR